MRDYISLTFRGKPISKDNEKLISKHPSAKTGRHYTYLSTKYKIYEKSLKRQAWQQLPKDFKPLEKNVWVSLFFYFKNRRHGDILNLPKSICDAMNGILWKDDRQCWIGCCFPAYGDKEGFTLIIREVLGDKK